MKPKRSRKRHIGQQVGSSLSSFLPDNDPGSGGHSASATGSGASRESSTSSPSHSRHLSQELSPRGRPARSLRPTAARFGESLRKKQTAHFSRRSVAVLIAGHPYRCTGTGRHRRVCRTNADEGSPWLSPFRLAREFRSAAADLRPTGQIAATCQSAWIRPRGCGPHG